MSHRPWTIIDELVEFGPEDFDRIRRGMDPAMTDSNDTETTTETTEVTVEKPAKEVEHTEVTETTEKPADGE